MKDESRGGRGRGKVESGKKMKACTVQRRNSDLDILVTFEDEPSLLTFIAIENYLSDLLGVKVDLVMKDSLKPAIGKNILRGRYKGKGLMKAFAAEKKREREAVA